MPKTIRAPSSLHHTRRIILAPTRLTIYVLYTEPTAYDQAYAGEHAGDYQIATDYAKDYEADYSTDYNKDYEGTDYQATGSQTYEKGYEGWVRLCQHGRYGIRSVLCNRRCRDLCGTITERITNLATIETYTPKVQRLMRENCLTSLLRYYIM